MTTHQLEKASVAALDAQVRAFVKSGKFGDALDAIRQFVESVIFDQKSVAKVFASTDIDKLCRYVGEVAATTTGVCSAPAGRRGTVVLATELVKAGGHVELLKDIIRLKLFDGPFSIVLTDLFARVDDDVIADFSATCGVNVEVAKGPSSDERLIWVLERLRSLAPTTLVLLTHNQDSVGVSAAHAHVADKVVFIHHGDHHLSLGVTCEDFIHIDPSNIGYFHCRDELGFKNNHYWPLTVNCRSVEPRVPPFLAGGHLITCSSGRPEKFDASHYLYDYVELIPRLLAATGGRHIHIGSLTVEMEKRLQHGLSAAGVDPASFIHVAWVPSIARALVEYKVDLYMSSFPFGGGKASVEAMAAGIPLLMHQNYRSRFLGGADIAYPEAWIWRNEAELLAILNSVTAEELMRHSLMARTYYENFHSDQALIEAADLSRDQNIRAVPKLREYANDALQVFLDETAEFKDLKNSNLSEIERVNNEWLIATKEIERTNSEWLIAVKERDALEALKNSNLREIERVNNAWLVAMKEIERTKSEWLIAVKERDELASENARLRLCLDSPKALVGALIKLLFSGSRH